MPIRADHRDLQQASAECRSRLIAALLMTMAADTILACIGGFIMLALYVGAVVQQGM